MQSFDDIGRSVRAEEQRKRESAAARAAADSARRRREESERSRQQSLGRLRESQAQTTWDTPETALREWERRARDYVAYVNRLPDQLRAESQDAIGRFGSDTYSVWVSSGLLARLNGGRYRAGRISLDSFYYLDRSTLRNTSWSTSTPGSHVVMRQKFVAVVDDQIRFDGGFVELHCADCVTEVTSKLESMFAPQIAADHFTRGDVALDSFVADFHRLEGLVREKGCRFTCRYQGNSQEDESTTLSIPDFGYVEIPRLTENFKSRTRDRAISSVHLLIRMPRFTHSSNDMGGQK
jgi:hypothetical protein